ncbi:cation efflux family-domain-containing protein [Polychytrium aggregatum]|uniref:cation efflux family-domain-containing protein n=1 Tax=Polychytrium aggregatum TaxID=110093 RepID=UPI0022FF15D7|nr:cation efflux family-domain-containing protein [Polychytrium aggregatum]KAI9206210.1 cation efflux family-domain-containing protein [Polychytrium aggregatum]
MSTLALCTPLRAPRGLVFCSDARFLSTTPTVLVSISTASSPRATAYSNSPATSSVSPDRTRPQHRWPVSRLAPRSHRLKSTGGEPLTQQHNDDHSHLHRLPPAQHQADHAGSHTHSGGHHHHHHHHGLHDSTQEGHWITIVGLISNVGLTGIKGAAGVMWNSASLLADALHSASDLVADFVTLYSFRRARTKPDSNFPYGYGKLESVGSLVVAGILIAAGVGVGWHSYDLLSTSLTQRQDTSEANGRTQGHNDDASNQNKAGDDESDAESLIRSRLIEMSPLALLIVGLGIFGKEALYHLTVRAARKAKSDVLMANAWHHRSDAGSSVVALVGVGGAALGFPLLDPIGGILLSGMILKAGIDSGVPAFWELIDASVPPTTLHQVRASLHDTMVRDSNIVSYGSLRGRKMGPYNLVDLQLQVNPHISVSTAHQIAENVRHQITKDVEDISEVLIHVDCSKHSHVHPAVATTESTSDIERRIHEIALRGVADQVSKITHLTLHYLGEGIQVHADLELIDNATTVAEASEIAKKVRENIMSVEGVCCADIHLEI